MAEARRVPATEDGLEPEENQVLVVLHLELSGDAVPDSILRRVRGPGVVDVDDALLALEERVLHELPKPYRDLRHLQSRLERIHDISNQISSVPPLVDDRSIP